MKRFLILSGSSLFRESLYSIIANASSDTGRECEIFTSETVHELLDECRNREASEETKGKTYVFIDLTVGGIGTLDIAGAFSEAVPNVPVAIHLPYSEFDIFSFYQMTSKNIVAVIDKNSSIARVYSLAVTFLSDDSHPLPEHFRISGLIKGTVIFREKDYLRGASVALSRLHLLSPSEEVVFYYLAFGYDDDEIAEKLDISPNTVRRHIQSIKSKLNEFSRYKLVSMSIFSFINAPWRKKFNDFEIPGPGITWSRKEDILEQPMELINDLNALETTHPTDWS